jgi:DNA-binding MurR/RpiR family transcriptional regulator
MTTQEVAEITGFAISTVCKYADILKIEHFGEGRRKIYNWKKTDVERLKKSIGKRGRPKKSKN